jgi:hypothetical protein
MPPSPRQQHSAVMTAKDEMIIFGGVTTWKDGPLNDIAILDTSKLFIAKFV